MAAWNVATLYYVIFLIRLHNMSSVISSHSIDTTNDISMTSIDMVLPSIKKLTELIFRRNFIVNI